MKAERSHGQEDNRQEVVKGQRFSLEDGLHKRQIYEPQLDHERN